ncbi:MAG: toll/interleukin-1 receptor domain-containing protein [Sphaerochaetaceae bacterium]|nr:toll/interleukin-1 receptor domain-containing protein [Sphaerochaetaceae bacterium]
MAVFISHTTADDRLAKEISQLLENENIECYIDDLDYELKRLRGNATLTPYLVARLEDCDTLLAIVTENTKNSWWVPFEIGTAREMPRIITSVTNYSEFDLPEYLLEWPRLRHKSDIEVFIRNYKNKRSGIYSRDLSESVNNVRSFEKTIMDQLNQRQVKYYV